MYTALLEHEISDYTLEEIRESINRAWVLGDGRFKKQIESATGRQVSPNARGGDRKSEKYKVSIMISYSDPIDTLLKS